jgi:hypothetical protein
MHPLILTATVLVASCAHGQNPVVSCRLQDQYQVSPDPHPTGADGHVDRGIVLSRDTAAHHFVLLPDGGMICVETTREHDEATRDQIRTHLSHVAGLFSAGDFDVALLSHETTPPGVPVMKEKHGAITYSYQDTERGGQVRIKTADGAAIEAVHAFLSFQLQDHRSAEPVKQ